MEAGAIAETYKGKKAGITWAVIICATCLFFWFLPLSSFAQEEAAKIKLPPQRILKVSPLAIFKGPIKLTSEYRLGLEQITTSHQSIDVAVSYLALSPFNWVLEIRHPEVLYKGFRAQAMYRFYLNKRKYSPKGMYFAPHFSHSYLEVNEYIVSRKKEQLEFHNYSTAGLNLGAQIVVGDVFTFEFYTGAGVLRQHNYFRDSAIGSYEVLHYKPHFTLGTNIGIVL